MWFELKFDCSYRPGYPEDNTIILAANNIEDAVAIYRKNIGSFPIKGILIAVRKVYYVFDGLIA